MIRNSFVRNRKGLAWGRVIGVIVAIVTLLLLLGYISSLDEFNYEKSIGECRFFLEGVGGDSNYFNELTNPKSVYLDTISGYCHSKTFEFSLDYLEPVKKLVHNCFYKSGEGADILAANSYGKSVCIFCGFAKSDGTIDDFGEEFAKSLDDSKFDFLKKSSETENLNEFTLFDSKNLPKRVESDENLIVYYFIYRPEFESDVGDSFFDDLEEIGDDISHSIDTGVSRFFSGFDSGIVQIATRMASNPGNKAMSGIAIQKWRSENEEFKIDDEVSILAREDLDLVDLKCDNFVVPKRHYG